MFDHIKIEGFRSFKKVELDLPPLSVLIGPNNGGKSNFLDLVSLMAEAGEGRLDEGIASRGGSRSVTFGFNWFSSIAVELRFRTKMDHLRLLGLGGLSSEEFLPDATFKLELSFEPTLIISVEQVIEEPTREGRSPLSIVKRDARDCIFGRVAFMPVRTKGQKAAQSRGLSKLRRGTKVEVEERKALESRSELAIFQVKDSRLYPTPYRILRELQQWTTYRDINVGPGSPLRLPGLVRPTVRLAADGANLSSVLYSIQQQHPGVWEEIIELLRTAYPDFKSITFPPEGGDGKVILRWWESPFEKEGVSANFLSDGTLKFLCLMAILKSPDPPPLICIDEPELGLHPDSIKLVGEMMQSAAARTQLIVATHSPQIVAKLDPEQVIVTEKENGETHLRRLERRELEKWLKEFNLSDLWLAGHFGGRP